jgi:hypothetical protein
VKYNRSASFGVSAAHDELRLSGSLTQNPESARLIEDQRDGSIVDVNLANQRPEFLRITDVLQVKGHATSYLVVEWRALSIIA